jgi:hypothetical protein
MGQLALSKGPVRSATMDKKPAFQVRGFPLCIPYTCSEHLNNIYWCVFDKKKFLCAG